MKITCIGGCAISLTGVPQSVLRLRDSNIGTIQETVGGVAFKIASNLASLEDCTVSLISAVGADEMGEKIIKGAVDAGIDVSRISKEPGPSGRYVTILDSDRDLLASISDLSVMSSLTPERLGAHLEAINTGDAVLMDANLSAEAIHFLVENVKVPLFYEPVSRKKALRIQDGLGKCFAVKPNRFEAAALSGCSCDSVRGAFRAAEFFLKEGVK